MLTHEYNLLIERLWTKKSATRGPLLMQDTVTRGAAGHAESQGWIRTVFRSSSDGANEIIIHVRMLDARNIQQQLLGSSE